jgi:hypothetical protein
LECIIHEEKCEVNFRPIREVTEAEIITEDGTEHKLDVLICATGFDVSFRPRYTLCGKNGADMADVWRDSPETYLSVTAPQFPNFFSQFNISHELSVAYKTFGILTSNSDQWSIWTLRSWLHPVIEIITRYVEKCLYKMQTEDIKSFIPKQAAVDDFKRHRELFLKRTAWSSPCRSWFKGGKVDGPILMWPGSRLHFFDAMGNPRWEVRFRDPMLEK